MTDTPTDDETTVRPFASFLQEIQGGRTHDELSEAFRDLITAVTDTGKGGKLTFVVDVKPMKGGDGVLVITDGFTVKKPSHDRKTSLFYATEDGNLTKENPHQLSFDNLKVVENNKGDVVDLDKKKAGNV